MDNPNLTIIDLYGNSIEVTNLADAIAQAKCIKSSPFKETPFTIVNGNREEIKGRENETLTVGDYWVDALEKLNNLENGTETTWSLACKHPTFNDFHVTHPIINRVKVPHLIKSGDIFNAYYGQSSKTGLIWQGSLTKSINDAWYSIKGYKIRYNSFTKLFHVNHDVIGVIGDYDDLEDAVKDCKKG
jgi:hypothetical protein